MSRRHIVDITTDGDITRAYGESAEIIAELTGLTGERITKTQKEMVLISLIQTGYKVQELIRS